MNIKEASTLTGLPAKTIRYYEEIGLITPRRLANGYRRFAPADLDRLDFLARARALGFTIEDCRALLSLRADPHRASADVKRIAQHHLDGIDDRIAQLEAMRAALATMVAACPGDAGPQCAILSGIAGAPGDPPGETRGSDRR
ncbi:transcriptional regulator [Gemmobacter megaterium]|uniref:Transcriptional regulator n=1 Tax=Gemmobacter megaterium TaxID=1086013 RepID=A0A1N7PCB4_9RHOB|nr:MerR family DNA-binding protein [Gemmobacter megaterium]GGE19165.1 Cu(I)-responsive transcriptional regulator [Gemmobacter megaterium]SIT08186.1 transcriptional regulator [Gemmobacter megaterium]